MLMHVVGLSPELQARPGCCESCVPCRGLCAPQALQDDKLLPLEGLPLSLTRLLLQLLLRSC
jgi:hypothetical protein